MLGKLSSNTLIGLGGNATHKVLGFITTLVLARGLGQDGFGIYSFVGVYIFFTGVFVDLGVERVVTRELAQTPRRAGLVLGNAMVMKWCLCLLVIPGAYATATMMGVTPEARYCILIAALGLPLFFDPLFRSYFQSHFEVKYVYAVTMPSALFFLGLAALCVHWALPVHFVFYAALLNAIVTLGVWLSVVLPRVRPILRPDLKLLKALLRDAGELGLFGLLFVVAMRIDQILLFELRDATEVGRYAVAVRVTEALSLLPEALMLTVFPLLASSQQSAPERFRHTYRLSFKYLSAVICPLALILTLLRREFVVLVFGSQYSDSATPLAILAWGTFFAYAGAVYLSLFIVQRRQRLLLLVSVAAVGANILSNLLLIPSYGATGAAVAMVIGNVVGFACWAVHPETRPFMAVCIAEAARPLVAVLTAWAAVAALSLAPLPAAIVAVPIYAIVMAVIGGFTRSDIDLVRQLFAAGRVA